MTDSISSHPIRYVTLRGTHRDAGLAHGELLKEQIRGLADERISIVARSTGASISEIARVSMSILGETEKALPRIWEEAVATSFSAGIEPWQLIVAGGFSDVLDQCSREKGAPTAHTECTLSAIRLTDQRPLLVGTWDTHASAQSSLIIVDRKIGNHPRTLALSTAGWPMQQGINEFGLAFAIANIVSNLNANGTSYICALPAVVSEASCSAASRMAEKIQLCSARYFLFVDRDGNSVGIEHDSKQCYSVDAWAPHTNHFISKGGGPLEGRPNVVPESERRRSLMQKKIARPFSTIESVLQIFEPDPVEDSPIVKRGTEDGDRTCATFVISPVDGVVWYSQGAKAADCNLEWQALRLVD